MRTLICTLVLASAVGIHALAADDVPFKATWSGVTVSADLSTFPDVAVVAAGEGEGTELGHFTMVSPHVNNVFTFAIEGDHNFTASNGDTLTAHFIGQLTPTIVDGALVSVGGSVPCVVTGGTGRFAGATGSYTFTITAVPLAGGAGFASTATMDGVISSVGSTK